MGTKTPRSPYDREGGLLYFPRMVDKLRLRHRGELPEDYHANLGKGFDKNCCDLLRVPYEDLVAQVESEAGDADILSWCFSHGRRPSEDEIHVWNEYMRKRGWNDEYSDRLRSRLEVLGMADRSDVQTMFDLLDVDEGRSPTGAVA